MTSLLFENVWLIGAIGLFLTILTTYGWLQTGNSIAMRAAMGMFAATILLMLLSRWVVTDREVVRALVLQIADELEVNDVSKVRSHIHSEASETVVDAMRQLPSVKFSVANVKTIHGIDFKKTTTSTRAEVRMNVFVEVERNGLRANIPRWISVSFEKDRDRWLVVDFSEREPQHEFLTDDAKRRMEDLLREKQRLLR